MIKTDNINEYVILTNLKKYCENKFCGECVGCKIETMCDAFPVIPKGLEIKYEPSGGNKDEI